MRVRACALLPCAHDGNDCFHVEPVGSWRGQHCTPGVPGSHPRARARTLHLRTSARARVRASKQS
ncbi:hypothetical protein EON67_01635 [archaeon]|nr:MAG: hypothetical protein EON67_01635 [archaeon]